MKRTSVLLICALLATACVAYLGYFSYQFDIVQEVIADRSLIAGLLSGITVESFIDRSFEHDAFVWVAACLSAALGWILIWIGWGRSNRGLTFFAMLFFGFSCWMTLEQYYLTAPVIALALIGIIRICRIRAKSPNPPEGADPVRVLLILLFILTMLATAAAIVYGIKYT